MLHPYAIAFEQLWRASEARRPIDDAPPDDASSDDASSDDASSDDAMPDDAPADDDGRGGPAVTAGTTGRSGTPRSATDGRRRPRRAVLLLLRAPR